MWTVAAEAAGRASRDQSASFVGHFHEHFTTPS
jgi:hypothetical protein